MNEKREENHVHNLKLGSGQSELLLEPRVTCAPRQNEVQLILERAETEVRYPETIVPFKLCQRRKGHGTFCEERGKYLGMARAYWCNLPSYV